MIKKRFSHSIIIRFITTFLFLGVLPLLILMAWAIYGSNKSMMNHLEGNVFELLKQKAEYTSLQLATVENLINNIANVEDVITSLQAESDTLTVYQKLKIQAKIGYVLAGYINLEGIESIDIFSKNLNRYHFGRSLLQGDDIPSEDFFKILNQNKATNSEIFWHGVQPNYDNPQEFSLLASKKLTYLDHDSMKEIYIGMIVVHYSIESIAKNFQDEFSQKFSSFVVDNNGNIIAAPKKEYIGSDFKAINDISKDRLHNFDRLNFAGKEALLLKYNLPDYNLKFFTFISSQYLWHTQFDSLKISLIGLLTIIFFSAIIFYIFAKRVLFPIKELTEAFADISKNRYDLDSQIQITTIDEIGELQMWFNAFVKTMQDKHRYAIELKEQKEVAEIANRAKDNFLASISHELRTPLNGVISVSELLSTTELSTEQKDYLEVIQQSSDILYSLINQVLDFSKISANKLLLTSSAFDIISFLDKMVNLYSLQAKTKGLKFIYNRLADKQLIVKSDEMALQKILINLLSNSLKYTQEGSISFSVLEKKRNQENITLRISVADSGLGIPESKKKTIFEAFEQVDGSLSKKISGTGLGLSIAQQLAHLLNSEIILISPNPYLDNPDNLPGSVFYLDLTLPFGEIDKLSEQKTKADDLVSFPETKVLVVEDNIINQKVISAILHKLSVTVDIASNWRECLDNLDQSEYDIIFMDIQMPEVTGFDLTKMIREKGINIPIIAVSGNVIDEVKEHASRVGMDAFIVKPIKASEIIRVLKKYRA